VKEQPFVSVVTPFYNTADYLRECIESVLNQTHTNFEYLLVDNQSTDGSAEIAAEYAKRDPRVRLIRNAEFVSQVPNYNGAVRQISPAARYVKVVLADDYIFPECVEKMVRVAETHPTTDIIGSYYLRGDVVCGSGIQWPEERVSGRAASRLHLMEGRFVFGTPTTLLYRADLVARRDPFFSEDSPHEDTDLCHEVMTGADLGFVHQVLSFSRVGNGGVLSSLETFYWETVDFYMTLRKFGPVFLSAEEFSERMHAVRAEYMTILAESKLLRREHEFWEYHQKCLATVGEDLPSLLELAPQVTRAVIKAVVRPRWFLREKRRLSKNRERQPSSVGWQVAVEAA
jgi:glycosyltransferase involved in cell wall biosynthesis